MSESSTAHLVEFPTEVVSASVAAPRLEPTRIALSLGFAALYGLALGTQQGGVSLLRHALGTPLGLVVVLGVSVPALLVGLSMLNAPVSAREMAEAATRALGSAGLMLAGLAPATALLLVTIQDAHAASLSVSAGLLLSGGIGLLPLLASTHAALQRSSLSVRFRGTLLLGGFALFVCALAARTFGALLPVLGGAA